MTRPTPVLGGPQGRDYSQQLPEHWSHLPSMPDGLQGGDSFQHLLLEHVSQPLPVPSGQQSGDGSQNKLRVDTVLPIQEDLCLLSKVDCRFPPEKTKSSKSFPCLRILVPQLQPCISPEVPPDLFSVNCYLDNPVL